VDAVPQARDQLVTDLQHARDDQVERGKLAVLVAGKGAEPNA